MLKKMKGWKTYSVALFLVLYAIASALGLDVPSPDGEEALALSGAVMMILRFVTTGPAGIGKK